LKRHLCLAIRISILLAVVASVPGAAAAAEPKRGGVLRVAYGNEISNLDFHTAPGYEMNWVAMNIGCGLLNITTPATRESWTRPSARPSPGSSRSSWPTSSTGTPSPARRST
jgi:hypothetical protein